MRRKSIRQNSNELSDNRRTPDENHDDQGTDGHGKTDRKSNDEYKCGKADCGKLYHSYTAFYNHCKKSHEGIFPVNSLYNGKIFEGPSKNRGRPRIKKTDVKDSIQIQSLKTQNQLIQFLGTLPKKKKNEELIVYVANPMEQLDGAIEQMHRFIKQSPNNGRKQQFSNFITDLININKIVCDNDLPDFYDPIEIHLYGDKLDSYNFLSIYNFMMDERRGYLRQFGKNRASLMRKIIVIWLTRILEVPLLAEVVHTIAQMEVSKGGDKIQEKEYMAGKTHKFKQLIQKYFDCILNEQSTIVPGTGNILSGVKMEKQY